MIRSGELRHKVTIQTYTETTSAVGQRKKVYSDTGYAWAAIVPLSATETTNGPQVTASATHQLTLRYRSLRPSDRIRYGQRIFEIVSILNKEERNIELVVLAREEV